MQCSRVLSLIEAPTQTLEFLNRVIAVSRQRDIFIDMEGVKMVTPDGVLALLIAVIDAEQRKASVRGNVPADPEAKAMIEDSGFAEHVLHSWMAKETGKLHWSGDSANGPTAARMVDFACAKLGVAPKSQRYLYKMLLECMANTKNHASETKRETWYAHVYWDEARRTACFCFADNGRGIIDTLLADPLDATRQYVAAILQGGGQTGVLKNVLEGKIRSSTRKHGRGLGLPKIAELLKRGHIQRLVIFSNRAHLDYGNSRSLATDLAFHGTLLYWELGAAALPTGHENAQ